MKIDSSRTLAGLIFGGVALMVAACAPAPEDFQAVDERGYQACLLFDSQGAGGTNYTEHIRGAARRAAESKTPAIRGAVDDRNRGRDGDPVISDLRALKKACQKAGYRF